MYAQIKCGYGKDLKFTDSPIRLATLVVATTDEFEAVGPRVIPVFLVFQHLGLGAADLLSGRAGLVRVDAPVSVAGAVENCRTAIHLDTVDPGVVAVVMTEVTCTSFLTLWKTQKQW